MKMKRKLLIYLSIFLAAVVIPITYYATALFVQPSVYGESYLGELPYKLDRLYSIKGKKIVIISGSASAFGVDSKLIEEHIKGYQVANMGLYAGLGSKVMLDLSLKDIGANDIVIYMPEQNVEMISNNVNYQFLFEALDGHYDYLSRLDMSYWDNILAAIPNIVNKKNGYLRSGESIKIEGIYQRSSFNEYGDIDYSDRETNIMPNLYNSNMLVDFSCRPDDSFLKYLNDYNKKINKVGASMYYYFAPTNLKGLTSDFLSQDLDNYYSFLNKKLDFSVLGNPHNSIINPLYFYDTNFHLNKSGSIFFTSQLIKDIKLILNDNSKTNIVIPSAPEVPLNNKDGDNSFAEYFEYIEKNDVFTITGLKNKDIENITIPYRYKDKLVTSFNKNVFANNTKIRNIVIQDNITQILDNSFLGCPSLNNIDLINKKPNTISIGSGLLSGLNFKITVPKGYLSTYKLDYSWRIYSTNIFESSSF